MFIFQRFVSALIIVALLTSLIACNDLSPFSNSHVTDPSLLRISISISRRTMYDNQVTTEIRVTLSDKRKKNVANDSIQVKVNGMQMAHYRGATNYYVEYPHYQLTEKELPVKPDSTYTVTITLLDGKEYVAGTIRTQPEIIPERFAPPTSHPRTKELVLRWKNLETRHFLYNWWMKRKGQSSTTNLQISKITETKNEWGYTVLAEGSSNKNDYLEEKVGSGQGSLTIPVSFFKGPQGNITAVSLLFSSTEYGKVNEPFLSGSSISTHRDLLRRIEITD